MAKKNSEIIIPSSIADRKVLSDAVKEIVRGLEEKKRTSTHITDICKEVEDKTGVPAKYIRRMAKDAMNDAADASAKENDEYYELYDIVMKGKSHFLDDDDNDDDDDDDTGFTIDRTREGYAEIIDESSGDC